MSEKLSIIDILKERLVGKRLVPSQYPGFAGIVADVYQNDSGDETWIQIKFESAEAGVDGYYSFHDFSEEFEIE